MSKKPKDNTVGPWAEEKLEALRRGLDYYTTRLKKTPYWQKVYVDAFAGPGLSEIRRRPVEPAPASLLVDLFDTAPPPDPTEEEVRYLKGSPRVALDIPNPFDRYVLVERDPQRRAELEAMRAEYGTSRRIEVRGGDANEELLALLASGFSRRTHKVYAFLDPFGVQVPWSTIEALAATEAVEVMINFPLGMAVRRMLPRSGDVPEGWGVSLTALFGSPDWRGHAYDGVDLMGQPIKRADAEERLLAWYRDRLRQAFGYVSEPRLITNTRGNPLYYLIWAGPHPAGLTGADYIMKMKLKRSGGSQKAP